MTLVTRDKDEYSLEIKPEAELELVKLSVVRGLGEEDTHVFFLTASEAEALSSQLDFLARQASFIEKTNKINQARKQNG